MGQNTLLKRNKLSLLRKSLMKNMALLGTVLLGGLLGLMLLMKRNILSIFTLGKQLSYYGNPVKLLLPNIIILLRITFFCFVTFSMKLKHQSSFVSFLLTKLLIVSAGSTLVRVNCGISTVLSCFVTSNQLSTSQKKFRIGIN